MTNYIISDAPWLPFRRLALYSRSQELVREVYRLVCNFPIRQQSSLGDQMERASVSIVSNIAEGNGRHTHKSYLSFLAIARGSLYELIAQAELAKGLDLIQDSFLLDVLLAGVETLLNQLIYRLNEEAVSHA